MLDAKSPLGQPLHPSFVASSSLRSTSSPSPLSLNDKSPIFEEVNASQSSELDGLARHFLDSDGSSIRQKIRSFAMTIPKIDQLELSRNPMSDPLGFAHLKPLDEYATVDNTPLVSTTSTSSILREFRPCMIIIVSVVAKKTFAISVRVEHVCDKLDRVFRNIKNLSIYGSIETSELMDRAPDGATPDVQRALKPGDYLKAAIKEIDMTEGKLLLTLRKSQVNISLGQRHHRLGLLDSHLAQAEMTNPIESSTYENDLCRDVMFRNPRAVESMAAAYGLDAHGSFVLAQPTGPYYDDLRRVQNRAWAQEIVAQGIQHAKREDYKTAMKHYSHALHFDPDNRDAHVARGACFYNINMLEDAEKEFQEALRIDPTDANALRYMSSTKEKLKQHQRENEEAHISSISSSMASSRKPNLFVPTPQISLPTPPASSMPSLSSQNIATSSDQALHMLGVTTSTERLKELLKREERRRRTKEKEKSRDKTKKRKEKHKKRKREKDKDKTVERDKDRSRERHRLRDSRRGRKRSKESRSESPSSDASSENSSSRSSSKRPRRLSRSPDGSRG
eukprot:TRINITY_DN533_c0_g1_i5.p1 TRINITY_DN533_c0_g1~~TRINITY_DN533_c0_g1_i5.p1  ORF type:complete len:564 (-),score=67.31 TRINITY_DN533_c0_g1_i5:78-1769(-)